MRANPPTLTTIETKSQKIDWTKTWTGNSYYFCKSNGQGVDLNENRDDFVLKEKHGERKCNQVFRGSKSKRFTHQALHCIHETTKRIRETIRGKGKNFK